MILKSALALIVTTSLAGGAVYYGSIPEGERSANNAAAPSVQTPPAAEPEEKYIDRFVKTDDEPAQVEPQNENTASELDRLLDLEADVPDAPQAPDASLPDTSSDVEMEVEVIVTNPAAMGTQDLPRTVVETVTEPEIKTETEIETVTVTKTIETTTTNATSSEDVIAMVMAQTEMIGKQELKDQAYLDIVDYAARHRDYDTALTVLGNIKQIELRDTARARTAIAIAKDGDAARAFSIIDAVEIEQLRDVMRLQVIEALIVPAHMPQAPQ